MISTIQNYYTIWGETQMTVHRLFQLQNSHILIDGGVLTQNDFKISSLRQGEDILSSTRSELKKCIQKLDGFEDIKKLLEMKDVSDEHAALLKSRLKYIEHLKGAMIKAVQFMHIDGILENKAYDAIKGLIDAASGDEKAPRIEITIIL
ncbi:MAG: hypothetical protein M8349_09095 [ANME-2 cluster archaeon]|nr:hypothetical protein [ANME-2 cluster archaeon]